MQPCFVLIATVSMTLQLLDMTVPARQIDEIPMSWQIARAGNPATGDRRCTIVSLGGDVTADLSRGEDSGTASWSLRVGFGNQPGSLRYIRINKRYYTTDEESFHGTEAREIVEQLRLPGEFAFEWAKAPDHAKHPGLFGTGNFAVRAASCEAWVTGSPT